MSLRSCGFCTLALVSATRECAYHRLHEQKWDRSALPLVGGPTGPVLLFLVLTSLPQRLHGGAPSDELIQHAGE